MLRLDEPLLASRSEGRALGAGDIDPLPDDDCADPLVDPEVEGEGGVGEAANGVADPDIVLLEIVGEVAASTTCFPFADGAYDCVRLRGGVAGNGYPSTVSCMRARWPGGLPPSGLCISDEDTEVILDLDEDIENRLEWDGSLDTSVEDEGVELAFARGRIFGLLAECLASCASDVTNGPPEGSPYCKLRW